VSMPNGSDPIDRLRAADPVRAEDVPSASLARVSARVQEHIVTDIQHPTRTFMTNPLAKLGGLALAGAFALAIALGSGFNLGGQSPDPVGGNPAAGGGVASCLAYDTANLPTFDMVFDGTVTAIDGDRVTFDVNTGWKGADGSVTLTSPEVNVALTGPLPGFEVGGRYLITAAGSTINACGYSLDYDAETAGEWAAAFTG
jgi:hypothetical protein